MGRYADKLNLEMIDVAAPVFELRQKIIDGIAGEIAHQRSLYKKQRKSLAKQQNELYSRSNKNSKFYYHSGVYPRLWRNEDKPTGEGTYHIYWRIGKKSLNTPGAVKARQKGYRFTKHIKQSGLHGIYTKADLNIFLQHYDSWEIRLAYLYEQRLRLLRTKLQTYNAFLQTIKRAPNVPPMPRGYVELPD